MEVRIMRMSSYIQIFYSIRLVFNNFHNIFNIGEGFNVEMRI